VATNFTWLPLLYTYSINNFSENKVYQLLAHGRWFSPGTPASSTTKTGCHDIAERLLKVALNTKNEIKSENIKAQSKIVYPA